MAPPDTMWHKESLKLKEIFGTREGFEICPYQLLPAPIKAPSGIERRMHSPNAVMIPGPGQHETGLCCAGPIRSRVPCFGPGPTAL